MMAPVRSSDVDIPDRSAELLLGDEAVAQAAIDAGIKGAYSYPGTPATEILEYLISWAQTHGGLHARWSANEKVAFEEALGMSHVGRRAIVCMKHVGLNVAADPFMSSAITGAKGGLVIAVADDPGMHSSQNEQDSRYYAEFAGIPCFEPSDQQECYDMTREAFSFSERLGLPVMVRLVTRISHSRSAITLRKPGERFDTDKILNNFREDRDMTRRWTLIPLNARRQFQRLIDKQPEIQSYSEKSDFNSTKPGRNAAGAPHGRRAGLICCGAGYGYAREAMAISGTDIPCLKIGFYPPPVERIRKFISGLEDVLVIEDGYPFMEERLLGLAGKGPRVHGKRDQTLPRTGELDPDKVLRAAACLTGQTRQNQFGSPYTAPKLPPRPPALCPGCPHTDTFKALNEAIKDRKPSNVYSDVGCYALGALPPHNAVNTCVEMGACIGMAKGASEGGLTYSVAVIGDSTFGHSGLPALRGAAIETTPMTLIIIDNGTVAMTGGQESLATGEALVSMVKGLGVDPEHIRTINPIPKLHSENVKTISEELEHRGLSVVIPRRECIQTARKGKQN